MILARATNYCWFCFKWSLLFGACAAAVGAFYLHDEVDQEIRRVVQQRIAEAYPHLEVTVDSAMLMKGKGIEIRGVSLAEKNAEGPRAELIYLDRVFLTCDTDLKTLIEGDPTITRVTVSRPVVHATRRFDGKYSVEKLRPATPLGKSHPEIVIENGTIEIFDPLKIPSSTWMIRDVNLTLHAPDLSAANSQRRALEGTFSADHLHWGKVVGEVDSQTGTWSISGSIEGINVSPEFCRALPEPMASELVGLKGLRGRGTVHYRVDYNPPSESGATPENPAYRFALTAELQRGELHDPRVAYPLTIRHATVHVANGPLEDKRLGVLLERGGIVVEDFSASLGDAVINVWGHQAGFHWNRSPAQVQVEVRQLELDDQVFRNLPEKLQAEWHKYRPLGKIDANATLVFDGVRWYPEVHVQCLNVSFTHYKFDYRLLAGQGTVDLKNDCLEVNLTARIRQQPVQVKSEWKNVSTGPTGWLHVQGQGLLLDEDMIRALDKKQEAIVRSLNPHGKFDIDLLMWRERPGEPMHKKLVLDLKDFRITFRGFPYPLSHVSGTVSAIDQVWAFENLRGTNDTAIITCAGWMRPTPEGTVLSLRFTGKNVPLEEELRDAHQETFRRVWQDLQPQGKVDLVADVVYRPPDDAAPSNVPRKTVDVSVTAYPHSDCTSITPVRFPFKIGQLDGKLVYRDGRVTLRGRNPQERFKAKHGQVELAANCQCDFLPDGSWEFRVEDLVVGRLRADHEFVGALPEKLQEAVTSLNLTGPNDQRNGFELDLTGGFSLTSGVRPGDPVRSQWNVMMDFAQGGIDCGVKLENLHGNVHLFGMSDGVRFESLGELDIASATYKDYQFTKFRGPILINNRRVVLGTLASREPRSLMPPAGNERPRPMTAELFGGKVYGDAWITLDPRQVSYGIRAHLADADLQRCAQEVIAGRQNLKGKVMAQIDLRGTGKSLNGVTGSGMIWMRDADVYELPLIVSLLKILTIREPDQTAFRRSDMAFRIQGNHVYFDPINFYGDAISLFGRGQLNLNTKEIDLSFHTQVGRDEIQIPILREIMGGASRQILKIDVDGTLDDPKTHKQAIPFVNEMWQQLQNNRQMRTGFPNRSGPALLPALRQPNPTRQQ